MKGILSIAVMVGLATGSPLVAQTQEADAAVASESRTEADRALDESRQPADVLRFAGIREGDRVADFMAGGGYYTALIADIVGKDGLVYAINPTGFHDAAAWKQRMAAHSNIRPIVTEPRGMQLAPQSVDTIFTHLVFHDLYWESERFNFPRLDEKFMLANFFAAVKSGGTVIVIDHTGPAGDTRKVTADLHRIAPATVVSAMQEAGFRLIDQSDMLQRTNDDQSKNVFDESVRGKTDRFILKFQKPA
ncbi:class I SAM-dependent methyltransferase [Parerythrobacter jejuensis]|uniref:Methyltransferase n=1 Tax=Parerythrobacter jejuensis TaxID=795812 RepID=A0A845ARG3_9SPHN|nr:class I SAM-dependent methyltransferase [Parerythrobacter jejuensis]MXP30702.1 methyltransferase [Parerythrobacter jejuensis]MXP33462.1 methyltransferase [Parerythrobacter jejuensis]